ncbi:MAG TPA: MarR family transcriptional regulator [Acidimicrobiales bacterium]|nr:MarR family transcriptional regulator [Acidimicrobiales bacterium]
MREDIDEVLELWRKVQLVHLQLTARLHRGLIADVGSSYQDHVVLTELLVGPKRLSDLGRRVGFEKSRLSHQIDRLERDGLVRRRPSDTDGRSAEVVLTAAGKRLQRQATPGHLRRVEALFDAHLTAAERRSIGTAADRVLRHLGE